MTHIKNNKLYLLSSENNKYDIINNNENLDENDQNNKVEEEVKVTYFGTLEGSVGIIISLNKGSSFSNEISSISFCSISIIEIMSFVLLPFNKINCGIWFNNKITWFWFIKSIFKSVKLLNIVSDSTKTSKLLKSLFVISNIDIFFNSINSFGKDFKLQLLTFNSVISE